MIDEERKEIILNQLFLNHSVKVVELSKLICIGESTIRRDLKKLENAGYLKRIYGGAVRIDSVDREIPSDVRQEENAEAKQIICKNAVSLIDNGFTVSLDSSTTVQYIAPLLRKFSGLTVLSQGEKIIQELQYSPINLYCAGGLLSKTTLSYSGAFTRNFFSSFYVDISIISCKGISIENGLSWIYEEEADMRKIMLTHAKTKVLLCDHSKFDHTSVCNLFDLTMLDYIITDIKPSEKWIKYFSKYNIKLIYDY